MRRATASVESGVTSGISVQRAIIMRFEWVTQIWLPRTENSMLSWSISSDFDAIHCRNVYRSLKSRKINLNPYLRKGEFNVMQGHRCWYPRKASQQCLLWWAASLCLSAAVLTKDELITSGKITIFTPVWCPRSRGISSPSYHTVKALNLYITWTWIGTRTWHQDRQADKRTDRITIASTLRAVKCRNRVLCLNLPHNNKT